MAQAICQVPGCGREVTPWGTESRQLSEGGAWSGTHEFLTRFEAFLRAHAGHQAGIGNGHPWCWTCHSGTTWRIQEDGPRFHEVYLRAGVEYSGISHPDRHVVEVFARRRADNYLSREA